MRIVLRFTVAACVLAVAVGVGWLATGPVAAQPLTGATPASDTTPDPGTAPVPRPHEHEALHNVVGVFPGVISGAQPVGAAAFDELKSMGIRTIISVDGAAPEVEEAVSRGIRYVHIPVTYADVNEAQRLEIARAIRDLPGPVYLHCHHGKHRGPAAAASAGVALGRLTPEQGVALMRRAGTSDSYTGLYACVAGAKPASERAIDGAPGDFPSVRKPSGFLEAMVGVDAAWDNLVLIRKAGWAPPKDHPDLVPAAEAGRLADHLRFACATEKAKKLGPEFLAEIREASDLASKLERAMVEKAPAEVLHPAFAAVEATCKACHGVWRDAPSR